MAVRVDAGGVVARPAVLFTGTYVQQDALDSNPRHYDIAPDGRFLMLKEDPLFSVPDITFVQNWTQELLERVPTRRPVD